MYVEKKEEKSDIDKQKSIKFINIVAIENATYSCSRWSLCRKTCKLVGQ